MCDARKVRASGRGLQPSGVRVKDVADFRVYTEGAGEGNVEVKVIGPGQCWECGFIMGSLEVSVIFIYFFREVVIVFFCIYCLHSCII